MLKHRLLVGIPMAAAMGGVLIADDWFAPFYPILWAVSLLVAALATDELLHLFPPAARPSRGFTVGLVFAIISANWYTAVFAHYPMEGYGTLVSWGMIVGLLTFGVVSLMTAAPSGILALFYLGLLPCFLVRIRWLTSDVSAWALAATIFVPKVGDIGAYFTGRLIGRHKMAPRLSPKKTWEGFGGGLVASASTAVSVSYFAPTLFLQGLAEAVAFGLVLGVAGVLGDLFESWLKRRAQVKDASATLPGFGGVLDVIDSVLFAAPVAYLWFAVRP